MRTTLPRGALRGAAAGAAGTTVLNAVTYLDMVLRGRGTSSTPEDTVEKLSNKIHVPVPGGGDERDNRVSGLGALTGIVSGVGIGGLLGVIRAAGWRPGILAASTAATLGALLGTNGPMTALGITDPRTWPPSSWVSDVVPHLAYGVVTACVVAGLDR